MVPHYKHLTSEDRLVIESLLCDGLSLRAVAARVGVHASTICRERRRGRLSGSERYFSVIGQRSHDASRACAGEARRKLGTDASSSLWPVVLPYLRMGWSPQQITGRLRSMPASPSVSHETISAPVFSLAGLNEEILVRLRELAHRLDGQVSPDQAERYWRQLTLVGIIRRLPIAELMEAAQRCLLSARATRRPDRVHVALFLLASVQARNHRFKEAEELLNEMNESGEPADEAIRRWRSIYLQRLILNKQGRFEEGLAKSLEEEAWLLQRLPSRVNSLLTCRMNQCATLNALGLHEQALALGRVLLATPLLPPDSGLEMDVIESLVGVDRTDEALELARTKRDQWMLSPVLADGALPLALLAAARGRVAAALRIHAAWRGHLAAQGRMSDPQERSASNRLKVRCAAMGLPGKELDRLLETETPLDLAGVVGLALDD